MDKKVPVVPPKEQITGYQLMVSSWGAAVVLAGLESLLHNDLTITTEQRLAISGMVRDIRKMLNEDVVIEQAPTEVPESEVND